MRIVTCDEPKRASLPRQPTRPHCPDGATARQIIMCCPSGQASARRLRAIYVRVQQLLARINRWGEMSATRDTIARTLGRGVFPHQLSWLIDNAARRLIVSPGAIANRLSLSPSSRVLEIGPGSGFFSTELAKRLPNGLLALLDLQPE